MSVRISAWVFHESESTGNDRLVLLALADEADDDGRNAYPSIETMARKARMNRATVIRCISRLEAAGEILVLRPAVHGRGRHNRYVVLGGRDAAAVAAAVGWTLPAVAPASPDAQQTIPFPDPVDNTPSATRKRSEWSHQRPEMVAPGATRPIDPIDPTPLRSKSRTPRPFQDRTGVAQAVRLAERDAEWAAETELQAEAARTGSLLARAVVTDELRRMRGVV